MTLPEPRRRAIHHAGHAVVQILVARGRFAVERVAMDAEDCGSWRGYSAQGEAQLDREAFLGLYEFGLVTLAGLAAEERYLQETPHRGEAIFPLSDLALWQEQAWSVLGDDRRVGMVSSSIMERLHRWMEDARVWQVIETLAHALLAQGVLQGEALRHILAPLHTTP
ncbi:hypothetical protein GMLC_05360 [Geomonas limicola]|uniref:Peptidase M41 domain-containing protein n=1 Tax=Geomonas limicola TaxID=2740186 RepID=A0A6V8N554_9BACT|nr:hypothetical protein [Geomonas limicola]GFO66957.1 hypothetical protein GMLC_05360 [Geomonas limicola]